MVDGFLCIDEPAGCTSHDVVNRVRRLLGTRKVGHTGTLDPFATGVLPIAVGGATRAIQFLDEGEKEYAATLRLGIATNTLDITGTVISDADFSGVTEAAFREAMAPLTGEIEQIPPMFSAIKQGGQPLYKLARKGVEVERSSRQVTIHRLELLQFDLPYVRILARCSRGTYIRTLADDLGRAVECRACLTELRRTMSGPFAIQQAVTLEQLASMQASGQLQQHLLPVMSVLTHLPSIDLTSDEVRLVRNGQIPYARQSMQLSEGHYCLLVYEDELLAVACQCRGKLALQRVFT